MCVCVCVRTRAEIGQNPFWGGAVGITGKVWGAEGCRSDLAGRRPWTHLYHHSQFQPAQQLVQAAPKAQLVRGTSSASAQTYVGKDRSCLIPEVHVRSHRRGHEKIQGEGQRQGHFGEHRGRCNWRRHYLPEDWSPRPVPAWTWSPRDSGGPRTRTEQLEQVNV